MWPIIYRNNPKIAKKCLCLNKRKNMRNNTSVVTSNDPIRLKIEKGKSKNLGIIFCRLRVTNKSKLAKKPPNTKIESIVNKQKENAPQTARVVSFKVNTSYQKNYFLKTFANINLPDISENSANNTDIVKINRVNITKFKKFEGTI